MAEPYARKTNTVIRSVWIGMLVLLSACGRAPTDLSSTKPYADIVGTKYRVAVDDLFAYAIYGDWPDKAVTHVTLIPGAGISGYEVAFRRHVQKGTVLRVVGVWRRWMPFDNGVYYVADIDGSDIPGDAPVWIELFRGNEGENDSLNTSVYERIK